MTFRESRAVLLIAHGSRRDEANRDLARLAEQVRARGGYSVVEIAYLELAEPTIPQAARRCVEQKARTVLMLPYFLSAGAHVTEDLERFHRECEAEHPDIEFRLCPPLGLHPLLVDVVFARLADGAAREDRG